MEEAISRLIETQINMMSSQHNLKEEVRSVTILTTVLEGNLYRNSMGAFYLHFCYTCEIKIFASGG